MKTFINEKVKNSSTMKWMLYLLVLSLVILAGCSEGELPPEPNAPGATGNYYKAIGDWATESDTFWLDFDDTIECSPGERVNISFRVDDDFVYNSMFVWDNDVQSWDSISFAQQTIGNSNWIRDQASHIESVLCEGLLDSADENNEIFTVTYSCTRDGAGFDCNDNKWQLQVFSVVEVEAGKFELTTSGTEVYHSRYSRLGNQLYITGKTTLYWNSVPGALCYDIYQDTTNVITGQNNQGYVTYSTCWNEEYSVTSYEASGLSPDTDFTYTIIAKGENGLNITKSNDVVVSFDNWCVNSDSSSRSEVYYSGSTADSTDSSYYVDQCIDDTILLEQTCGIDFEGNLLDDFFENRIIEGYLRTTRNITCEFGCFDGACLQLNDPNGPGVISNTETVVDGDSLFIELNEAKTVSYNDAEYTIELVGANVNTSEVVIDVNGNRQTVSEGDYVTISGIDLVIDDLFITNIPTSGASARIVIGSDEVEVDFQVYGEQVSIQAEVNGENLFSVPLFEAVSTGYGYETKLSSDLALGKTMVEEDQYFFIEVDGKTRAFVVNSIREEAGDFEIDIEDVYSGVEYDLQLGDYFGDLMIINASSYGAVYFSEPTSESLVFDNGNIVIQPFISAGNGRINIATDGSTNTDDYVMVLAEYDTADDGFVMSYISYPDYASVNNGELGDIFVGFNTYGLLLFEDGDRLTFANRYTISSSSSSSSGSSGGSSN